MMLFARRCVYTDAEGLGMKAFIFSIALIGLLALGSGEVKAQMYGPYPYSPYWDGVQYQPYPYPQQYDPYYDLHVMHYQLYLPQYSGYPIYQSCCFIGGIAPLWSPSFVTRPKTIAPHPRPWRRR
jgi:hypothetical protein